MKPNWNFYNEYTALIPAKNRDKMLILTQKMSRTKPGLLHESQFQMRDHIGGSFYVKFGNMEAFSESEKTTIIKYIHSISSVCS